MRSEDVKTLQDILYQDNLTRLQEKSNGKEVLNLRETALILGFKDTRTVKKLYPFENGYISLATLARCMTPGIKENLGESRGILALK